MNSSVLGCCGVSVNKCADTAEAARSETSVTTSPCGVASLYVESLIRITRQPGQCSLYSDQATG
jgi:hypothetical protein